jgi:hypothetical protein
VNTILLVLWMESLPTSPVVLTVAATGLSQVTSLSNPVWWYEDQAHPHQHSPRIVWVLSPCWLVWTHVLEQSRFCWLLHPGIHIHVHTGWIPHWMILLCDWAITLYIKTYSNENTYNKRTHTYAHTLTHSLSL